MAVGAPPSWAQGVEAVGRARTLYAQAAYEDALAALGAINDAALTWDARRRLAETRVLCLVALRRTADAQAAMARLADLDPRFTFPDASPSTRAAFLKVRGERLPSIVRARFTEAREAFARGDYVQAQAGFGLILDLVADPVIQASDLAPLVGDLGVVAGGYLDLATRLASGPAGAPSAPASAVQPPVPIDEQLPPWLPGHLRPSPPYEARLEIVIGRTGHVESARVLESSDRRFDAHVLHAARNWRYTPAFSDGVAVTFTKTLTISIAPQ
jgi:TonB family protein